MATLAAAALIVGTGVKAVGQIKAGNEAKKAADRDAFWMRRQAGARRAESQREAIYQRHLGDLAESRAQAVAAASGAGATDPTVTNIIADIDAESEFRALSRLYSGEDEAEGLEYGALQRQREGKAARTASRFAAASTIFNGYAAYDHYFGSSPSSSSSVYGPPT